MGRKGKKEERREEKRKRGRKIREQIGHKMRINTRSGKEGKKRREDNLATLSDND